MDEPSRAADSRNAQRRRGPDVSRRRFLTVAGAAGIAGGALGLPGAGDAQATKVTKETLKPVVEVAELAITDEQLGKIAGAMGWARGELKKLRDVETGLIGPAPAALPFPPAVKGGDGHE
jgi:hypothetical protein